MDFGTALRALKSRQTVRRANWPDGTFLVWVPGSTFPVDAQRPLGRALPGMVGETMNYGAHIDKVRPGARMEPWTPSQEAILALDWELTVG